MNMKSIILRSGTIMLGLCLALNPASARKIERGVESAHQPVVQRTDFVFDVADNGGAMNPEDQKRLIAWFRALSLGYGDHVTLAENSAYGSPALRDAVADMVGRFGLLIEGEAPATVGEPPAGGLRVVVSRSVATVPGCPAWKDKAELDLIGGLSDNYGCATAGNLAAMVADPRDLVEGREQELQAGNVVSTKAIKAYQEKAPSGGGGGLGGGM